MITGLFEEHLQRRREVADTVLTACGFDGMVVHSGTPLRYFADDQDAPFHTTPHFLHWLPLEGPGHLLLVRPGRTPTLIRHAPADYWYETVSLDRPFWAPFFEIKEAPTEDAAFGLLGHRGRWAFLGDHPALAQRHGFSVDCLNPADLVAHLDWHRSFKTAYEVECIAEATRSAARGHRAAREAFEHNASELEIHQAYVQAVGCVDRELPYESIVALDEKAATLHYTGKRTTRDGRVLLLDSGASHHGYASDITRTWARQSAHPTFRELLARFEDLQQGLCREVRPGVRFPDFHAQAHQRIGALLADVGVLTVPAEEAVERKLTGAFFPHGLGHFLGLQVHDVSGHQKAPSGGVQPPPTDHPYLRSTRQMEESQVFTVEPGIYFIELLLAPHRSGPTRDAFAWDLIGELAPFGGMRIEDDVVVTADGHRNLTRKELP